MDRDTKIIILIAIVICIIVISFTSKINFPESEEKKCNRWCQERGTGDYLYSNKAFSSSKCSCLVGGEVEVMW